MFEPFGHPFETVGRAPLSPPRASLIASLGGGDLWMGGAEAHIGDPVPAERLRGTLIIDCAGDMPKVYRQAADRWLSCVFADLEHHPTQLSRIVETAREAATCLRGAGTSVYVFCQYGMNRSGLVTGIILRELGFEGSEAIARIRGVRPGALSNLTFLELLEQHRPA